MEWTKWEIWKIQASKVKWKYSKDGWKLKTRTQVRMGLTDFKIVWR